MAIAKDMTTALLARNDSFTGTGLTEDSKNIVTLDVMRNDSGERRIMLWSLDNGVNSATDLLVQDKARTEGASADRSANGATIWITNDSKVGYDITTASTAFKTQLQGLTTGQSLTDTFTYAIKQGNSAISWATATITIRGINDTASISGTAAGALTEDNAITIAGGALSVADVDSGQAVFRSVLPAALVGIYGNFTFNAATGVWGYTLDNSRGATQALTGTSSVSDNLTVLSADGSANQIITITIAGTNDTASISGTATGALTEDNAVTTAVGTLSVADVDSGEAVFQQVLPAALVGSYGNFTFNAATGAWGYTLDNSRGATQALTGTSSVTDKLTVKSADGTASQIITMIIAGTNDVPTISGTTTGSVTEDTNPVNVVLSFGTASVYSVGPYYPNSVAIKDVNGDNKPDIVTTNNTSNNVSVLLGNGLGAFGTASVYGVGAAIPHSVAVTDVNGDGKRDIVTADLGSDAVSVLLNNGLGVFNSPTVYVLGVLSHQPGSVAVTDVNGDSKPDIVTANFGSNNVSVLLGDGSGSFNPPSVYSLGGVGPFGIVVKDVSGDGRPDIVTADTDSNNVSVLLGDGSGGFGTASVYGVGAFASHPEGVAVMDVNGDSKPDIVTVNFGSSNVSVLLGDGLGGFNPPSVYGVGALKPYGIAVRDVNGDSRPDIVTADIGSSQAVSVLLNNSRGDLVASGALSISDPDAGESSFAAQPDTLGNHGYGRFSIDTGGQWHYIADNSQSVIQALGAGDTLTDSFTVSSFDRSAHQDITVTIIGVAEAVF